MGTDAADRAAEAPTTISQALRAADPKRVTVMATHGNADSDYMSVRITKAEAKRLLRLHCFIVMYAPHNRSLELAPPLAYENKTELEIV